MHRIDTATSENGKFVNGNSNQGIKGTQVDNTWLNSVQEELANIVESAGDTLSKSNDAQVLAAMKKVVAGMFAPINSEETLLVNAGNTEVGDSVSIKAGDVLDITLTCDVRVVAESLDGVYFCPLKFASSSYVAFFDTTVKGKHTIRFTYTATEAYTGKIGYVYWKTAVTSANSVDLRIAGVIIHNA